MATTTPFTYNNGAYIPGTEQIGDLSIGLLSQDYASNPGGKTWWMGPDEDNIYVIGKDVPTQDHPTPLGNIGSVEFWATTTRDDSQFISITNKLGKNSFTTTSECLSWLNTNGYWSNYTNINGQTLISQSSWKIRDNSINTVDGWVGSIFDSDRELFISSVYKRNSSLQSQWLPYLISSSDFPLSGEAFFSGSDYFLDEGAIQNNGSTGYWYLSQNTSSNHLYSLYGDPTYNSSQQDRGIIKWNLDTRNRVDEAEFSSDFGDTLTSNLISTYCPGNDKVYVTGEFEVFGYSPRNEIQIFSGSSLSTNREIITSPGGIGRIYSSTDNSGKILWINGGGSSSRWYIISGSSFVHTGNVTPSTTNSMNPVSGWQAAYSKTSKKFYAMGIKPTNGNTVETAFLWVIDPFNLTDKVIEFGETDTLNQNVGGGCVWDANRNCIWTLDLDGKLFAIECGGDTIVKSNITLSKASLGNVSDPSVPMVIDTTSDYLILPNIVWDLSQIWSI
jgi:hypothetical protein